MLRSRHSVIALLAAAAACKGKEPPPSDPGIPGWNEPVVLARDQPGPAAIALDATSIYWNDWGKPVVRKMPRAGGPVTTLYEGTGPIGGRSIGLDDDGVYFDEAFTIKRVPKAGGTTLDVGSYDSLPARFVADRSGAYAITNDQVTAYPRSGAKQVLAGADEGWDIAVDATHVYWVARSGVWRVAKTGAPVEQLAVGTFRFARIALSETDVYWGDGVLEAIFSVPKAGGRPRYIAHAWDIAGKDLAIAGNVVWAMKMSGLLERIDPATGKVTIVAAGLERGGAADHYIAMELAGDDAFVASGGESGGGGVIDLTRPNAKLPEMTYGGELLRVATREPPNATVTDEHAPQIAMVWFAGDTTGFQDRNNAVRWIDNLPDTLVADIRAGKVGLILLAELRAGLTESISRQRAKLVEDAIRDKLGLAVRIATKLAPPRGYHGDVEVTLDVAELAAAMQPAAK